MAFKVLKKTITITKRNGNKVRHTLVDPGLERFKVMVVRMMFSLAHILKISPKKLAQTYSGVKPDEYAQKFDDELIKMGVEAQRKASKSLEKDLNG